MAERRIVELAQVEAGLLLGGRAEVLPLLVADKIGRQLRGAQLQAHPFARSLALLLESALGQQLHCLLASEIAGVEVLIDDRIDRQAQLKLVMCEQIARVPVEIA